MRTKTREIATHANKNAQQRAEIQSIRALPTPLFSPTPARDTQAQDVEQVATPAARRDAQAELVDEQLDDEGDEHSDEKERVAGADGAVARQPERVAGDERIAKAARKNERPILPNPLIPIRVVFMPIYYVACMVFATRVNART